jgi:hypothetical protein
MLKSSYLLFFRRHRRGRFHKVETIRVVVLMPTIRVLIMDGATFSSSMPIISEDERFAEIMS